MQEKVVAVKNLCRQAVRRVRCQPARDHILSKLRVMVDKRERWVDTINSKKAAGTFSASMQQLPGSSTGRLATSPSLRA
eukprot:4158621-Pyramimonas_sp.AAC.1